MGSQDGQDNYIWVVGNDHTEADPKIKIFGRTPIGSEPTGITFSPDFRFLFMSIQHPDIVNNTSFQIDAANDTIYFDRSISLVISRTENLGKKPHSQASIHPNPVHDNLKIHFGEEIQSGKFTLVDITGRVVMKDLITKEDNIILDLSNEGAGMYFLNLSSKNNKFSTHKIIKL